MNGSLAPSRMGSIFRREILQDRAVRAPVAMTMASEILQRPPHRSNFLLLALQVLRASGGQRLDVSARPAAILP